VIAMAANTNLSSGVSFRRVPCFLGESVNRQRQRRKRLELCDELVELVLAMVENTRVRDPTVTMAYRCSGVCTWTFVAPDDDCITAIPP